jgi:hypothetical protein
MQFWHSHCSSWCAEFYGMSPRQSALWRLQMMPAALNDILNNLSALKPPDNRLALISPQTIGDLR